MNKLEVLINALKVWTSLNKPTETYEQAAIELLSESVIALAEIVKEQQKFHHDESTWISAAERLPEPGSRVLATNGVLVGVGASTEGGWIDAQGCLWTLDGFPPVTHWQSLPQVPDPNFAALRKRSDNEARHDDH